METIITSSEQQRKSLGQETPFLPDKVLIIITLKHRRCVSWNFYIPMFRLVYYSQENARSYLSVESSFTDINGWLSQWWVEDRLEFVFV